MDPLLEFVPDILTTPRLILRCARAADAPAMNAAVIESIEALRPHMPWAQTEPSLAQSEGDCRRMQARFLLREDLPMLMFERAWRRGWLRRRHRLAPHRLAGTPFRDRLLVPQQPCWAGSCR